MLPAVDFEQTLAFRLEKQHLARRLPGESLLEAAAACGIQNTPPGSAELALHARVSGLTPQMLEQAFLVDKTLIQTWSMRASPTIFPTEDMAVFTFGVLPDDKDSMRFFILGAEPALDQIGMEAADLAERIGLVLPDILNNRQLTKDELGGEIATRLVRDLSGDQRRAWLMRSWYAPDQSLGESVTRFAICILALQGLFCISPQKSRAAEFLLTDQWLGEVPAPPDPVEARAELVRRYLHCYGPSRVNHFAEWAGISQRQAERSWALVEKELVGVVIGRHRTWLHESDAALFMSPPAARGLRLLPPHDPYLLLRDREVLIANRSLQRQVWRSTGNPGVVLKDGRLSALWRAQKKGQRLQVSVETLAPPPSGFEADMEDEAAALLPFRECTQVEVRFSQLRI